jgi:hypothetical protein
MAPIPNFKAQGLIASDHDLGATMRQSPPRERGLPPLYSSAAVRERK